MKNQPNKSVTISYDDYIKMKREKADLFNYRQWGNKGQRPSTEVCSRVNEAGVDPFDFSLFIHMNTEDHTVTLSNGRI